MTSTALPSSAAKPTVAVLDPPRRGAVVDPLGPVAGAMARLESLLTDDAGIEFPVVAELLRAVFGAGGKRLRPAVVFHAAALGTADDRDPTPVGDAVLRLAAAVETLHTATLVHDDLVDGALVRRGLPTLNARWQTGATVLAGDWLFARAARFAADTGSVGVMRIFARTLGTLTDGELRQLLGRADVPDRAEYARRIYAKTASLFEAAAEATAVLLALSEDGVATLARYGRAVGMAFQVVDDLLDFTADETRLGKPVGSDLRSGQVTLPVLLHLERNPGAADGLSDGDGRPNAVVAERLVAAVRADDAALDGARAAARAHVAEALEALGALPAGPGRDGLAAVAEYAVARDV